MHFHSTATITMIERDVRRSGFDVPFYQVWVRITCDGLPGIELPICLRATCPDDQIERIARRYLADRLQDMADAVVQDAVVPNDLQQPHSSTDRLRDDGDKQDKRRRKSPMGRPV